MSESEFAEEQAVYATLVEINQEPIELYKILKIENLVSGGGEAKQVISEGYVYLNGEIETRKRKKIYAGDLVSFNEQHFQIALKGETEQYEFVEEADSHQAKAINSTPENPSPKKTSPEKRAEKKEDAAGFQAKNRLKASKPRKPISF
ncbi:MAG: ribosome-associated protein [Psychromonas sp.]|jgi:ribosome-associated protein|uniref:RNA-binding S4 domain-containing protein n=1 Tax=Psychromonas sp. TaxID=1884585 RepID=UPI0039E3159E